jgi:TRAP-type C4-dicarboxylate transport system permease small subunit
MKNTLVVILNFVYQIEKFISAAGFALMTLLVLLDIFSREVLKVSFPWSQKSAVYLMIWLGFVGASLTSAKNAHLRPEIADKLWQGKLKPVGGFLEQLVIATFCLTMAYVSAGYIQESKTMGDHSVVTGIPMWILQLAIPYAFTSMGFRHLIYSLIPSIKPVRTVEDHK